MNLIWPLRNALTDHPDDIAVVFGDRRLTFTTFVDRVSRLASVFRALGAAPGDRIAMMGTNSDRYLEYLYAAWWCGAVINPVNTRWSAAEVAYSLDDCHTCILIVDEASAPVASELRRLSLSKSIETVIRINSGGGTGASEEWELDYETLLGDATPMEQVERSGDDLAAVMYTGGTTGQPKGVMLTHSSLYLNALSVLAAEPRPENPTGILVAPLFHVGGIGLMLQLMHRRCKLVVVAAFHEDALIKVIEAERGSEIFLVPTMLKRVVESPALQRHDVSSLQLILYGAAPIDSALLARSMKALPSASFCQVYGMTELSPVITILGAAQHDPTVSENAGRLRSAGRPVPIAEVRIVDDQDRSLPCGAVGEIVARGPMVMAGYWNKQAATQEALRGGWMHTGDGGYMDSEGFVYVVDRLKDMIISGGENVYSAEVENAIAQLPQVLLCAVVGVPDDNWGERVHAVVVVRPGETLDQDAVIAHCRKLIAGYKCPRTVEFRDELPLSAAGKLLKYQLREPFWAGRKRGVN
ncbi:MAG TPA: long-chain-fatty-acid--CoA ligase [Burkholderiaceae bacterium]|nr:long-chain-fatty-acid--CoA ligase [Burkholderiaceae bacterium]